MGAQTTKLGINRPAQANLFPLPDGVVGDHCPYLEDFLGEEGVTWEEVSLANKGVSQRLFSYYWNSPERAVHRFACVAIAIAIHQKTGEHVDDALERLFRKRSGRGGVA